MRIGLVVSGGFDPSGRERVIPALVWLVERLARRHAVHVFVLRYFDAPRTYELAGATVHDLGRPVGVRRQRAALSRALQAAGRFDVLHAYWATPAGVVAGIAGRARRTPVVVTLDSGELVALPEIAYGLQRTWRGRAAVKLACRLAARVTVCSAFMQALARDRGIDARFVPLGVDCAAFNEAVRPAEGPPWRLLQVASLNRVKDQATLLRALADLRRRGLDVGLDLVGEDTLDGSLQTLAADLDLTFHVTFHGFLSTGALPARYGSAHLYVQSSRHEAAGVAVLEAAACGVPVVGTAVGYVKDWARLRAAAVPPGVPGALAEAITDLLRDPDRRARLASSARAWAATHDADWTAEQFEEIYRGLTRRVRGTDAARAGTGAGRAGG